MKQQKIERLRDVRGLRLRAQSSEIENAVNGLKNERRHVGNTYLDSAEATPRYVKTSNRVCKTMGSKMR